MANFTEIKTGGWNDLDELTGDQISSFQDLLLKCPNASEGGEYALTNPIKFTGSQGVWVDALRVTNLKLVSDGLATPITLGSVTVTRTATNGSAFRVTTTLGEANNFSLLTSGSVAGQIALVKNADTAPGPAYVLSGSTPVCGLVAGEAALLVFNGTAFERWAFSV